MIHARNKLLASALAAVLMPAAALATVAVPTVAQAAEEADCQLTAVHALKKGDGTIPKSLEFLSD